MTCGIYLILNNKNGKGYVGQSINIEKRFKQHKRELNNNYHNNSHLQKAWNKYGKSSFVFLILEKTFKNMLNNAEIFWINFLETYNSGYNLTRGGEDNPMNYDEHRKKISISNKGRIFTDKHKRNISKSKIGSKNPMYGKNHTDKSKKKISQKHIGKKVSCETRNKISKNHANVAGHKNPRAKYTLWNINKVYYSKANMTQYNRKLDPCNCFHLKYNTYRVPCGGFCDFLSCEIINDLIKRWL